MRKLLNLSKTLLVTAGLCVGASNAWAEDWSTVWSTDFSSAPTGMTYSISAGSCNIVNGYLWYKNDAGSGDRTQTATFTADAFNVNTNWKMEFDWNCGQSNANASYVTFATNKGNAFTLSWKNNGNGQVTVTDASSNELTTTLPVAGYNIGSISTWSHIIVTGDTKKGVYLTITNGNTTYVNNVLVTSTYGYPVSFNGTLGKSVAAMGMDNITFATPKVAGYVAPPTGTITAPDGTARKFTLSCLTEGATIYYAESDLEIGAAGWTTYSSEATTSAETIYAYASDGTNNSEKISFATGAGTAITLNAPTISVAFTSNNSIYNPTYSFTSNQSNLLGSPTATITYSFEGGAATAGTSYTPTTSGSITVTVTADGYTSNSTTQDIVGGDFLKTYSFDAINDVTVETSSGTWENASNVNGAQWTFTDLSNCTYTLRDDITLTGFRYARATTAQTKQGFYTRLGAGSIGFSLNSAECITFTMLGGNIILAKGTSTSQAIGHYSNVRAIDVYTPATVSKTITSAGWATYCSPYALDFTNSIDNLTAAYLVTGGANGKVTLSAPINTTVPANTGLLLKGSGECVIPIVASSTTDVSSNKLQGVTADTEKDAETIYVLMNDATNGVGFYKNTNAFTVGANTAYLNVSDLPAPSSTRTFYSISSDEASGIRSIENTVINSHDVYNLSGQRISKPTKGLFIVNGKKVIK